MKSSSIFVRLATTAAAIVAAASIVGGAFAAAPDSKGGATQLIPDRAAKGAAASVETKTTVGCCAKSIAAKTESLSKGHGLVQTAAAPAKSCGSCAQMTTSSPEKQPVSKKTNAKNCESGCTVKAGARCAM